MRKLTGLILFIGFLSLFLLIFSYLNGVKKEKAEKSNQLTSYWLNEYRDEIFKQGYIRGIRDLASKITSECFTAKPSNGSEQIEFRFKDGVEGKINSVKEGKYGSNGEG